MLEHRSIGGRGFEIREITETESTFRFIGYGSVFDHPYTVRDWGGEFEETVERGAFKQTLSHNRGRIPVLGDHTTHIGYTRDGGEDSRGLWLDHELQLDVPEARAKRALVKQAHELERPYGESIGFSPIRDIWSDNNRKRRLKEVRLFEVSLTPFPANDAASVTQLRSLFDRLIKRGDITPEQLRALQETDGAPPQIEAELDPLHSISQSLATVLERLRAS